MLQQRSRTYGLLAGNYQPNLQLRLEELERRNQLLEAEVERLRVFRDYAYTDPLTEIPNRRFYYERLLQEIARSRRGNHALALALVDLDLFKEINDEVGHRGGDQVLKFFSQFLRVNLRQEDVLCRIGGDEFAVLMPDTTAERAAVFFDRVRGKLHQIEISIRRPAEVNSFIQLWTSGIQGGLPSGRPDRRSGPFALLGESPRPESRRLGICQRYPYQPRRALNAV